jgi:hypothetical protein
MAMHGYPQIWKEIALVDEFGPWLNCEGWGRLGWRCGEFGGIGRKDLRVPCTATVHATTTSDTSPTRNYLTLDARHMHIY